MNPAPNTQNRRPKNQKSRPAIRNPKPEIRNSKFETRDPKLETETRNPKPETPDPKNENRNSDAGCRGADRHHFRDPGIAPGSTRGERRSYVYSWVVRFVPFTGLINKTLAEIRERFVDEPISCLKRRSRRTFMNTRVLKIRHHFSLEWFHLLEFEAFDASDIRGLRVQICTT